MERILLIGAGFSANSGVPTALELAEEFKNYVKTSIRVSNGAKTLLNELDGLYPEYKDIEWFIAVLEFIIRASNPENPISWILNEKNSFVTDENKKYAKELLNQVFKYIRKVGFITDSSKLDYLKGLPKVFESRERGIIFSFNYDTVIERFYLDLSLDLIDGFEQNFNDKIFHQKERVATLLYKMHGSVTWYKTGKDQFIKIPVLDPSLNDDSSDPGFKHITGEKLTPLIVYPHEKGYPDWLYPIRRMRDHFNQKLFENLERDPNNRFKHLWISIGYSFRDKYIVQMIEDAAREDDGLFLMIISPSAIDIMKKISTKPNGTKNHLHRRIIPLPARIEDILPELRNIVRRFEYLVQDFTNLWDKKYPDIIAELLECYWIEIAIEHLEKIDREEKPKKNLFDFLSHLYKCLLLHSIIWPNERKPRIIIEDYFSKLLDSIEESKVIDGEKFLWRCSENVQYSKENERFEVIPWKTPKEITQFQGFIQEHEDYRKEVIRVFIGSQSKFLKSIGKTSILFDRLKKLINKD